jgi:DNA-binding PadR family transcriptional regulator
MLILRVLQRGRERHGFEIAQAIRDASTPVLRVEEGSLCPALQRLLAKGWTSADSGSTDENRGLATSA